MELIDLEVNGEWPELEGKALHTLICVEMLYDGKIAERANVNYLKFEDTWYRLYFDCGIIFWRKEKQEPIEFDATELNSSFRNVDIGKQLGLEGLTVTSIKANSFESGSEVIFIFEGGRHITFFDHNDVSDYRT
jgi:hypothetical protein